MMGNHRTLCTFTMQQIGRWVVTPSKADSNLHGHRLAISRKQCTPPPPYISYALVQATVGVGTVLIWDFGVAYPRGRSTLWIICIRILCNLHPHSPIVANQ